MLDAFLADGGRFEETADVTDEEAGIARDDPVTSAHAPTLAYPNLSLALARTLHQEYGGGSSEVEAPEEAAARAELEEALLCGASPLPRTRTDGAVAALRDEGVVRLGGALSVATAAALRVHILAQLNAALAEEARAAVLLYGVLRHKFPAEAAERAKVAVITPYKEQSKLLR